MQSVHSEAGLALTGSPRGALLRWNHCRAFDALPAGGVVVLVLSLGGYVAKKWLCGAAKAIGKIGVTVGIFFGAMASLFAQVNDPTLVAAYHCNEAAGGVLNDVSGRGNHGALPATAWTASGRYGAALSLNGTSDLVLVPDSASLDLTTAMTVEAWVYPTGSTNWQTVVMKEAPTGLAYTLYARVNAARPGAYINVGGADQAASSGTALPLNAWSHVAMTYNGTSLLLYVNGVLRSTRSVPGVLVVTSGRLSIGGNSVWGEYFRGRIDEVRIYSRVLTAAEIVTDMNTAITSALTVSVTAPAPGSTVSGVIALTASASGSPAIAGVQFKVNGNNLGAEDTAAPYSVNWDTVGSANGSYSISATVRDTSGNTANSAPITVTVANGVAPPTVSLTAPAPGTVTGGVLLTATANDATGIAGVQFLLNGAPIGAEDTTFPYSLTWDSASVADGSYVLAARARNNSGITATSAGVSVTVANSSNPTVSGQWSPLQNWPLVSVHGVLLSTGKVLVYDRPSSGATARVWDPVANTFTSVPNSTTDLFCSGHVTMADGRVLVVGGHGGDFSVNTGTRDVNIFDPVTMTWTLARSMAFKRWYSSATALPDGRVLVTSGSAATLLDYVATPEIYDPTNNTWTTLTGAPLSMPTYPQMFVLPDGRVANTGNYELPAATWILNLANQTWTSVDATPREGGAVMYEPGKILKSGSSSDSGFSGASVNTSFTIDFTSPTPAWQPTASMAYPRAHHNMTILPDGNVLVTGGGTQRDGYYVENAVYHAEMWSPVTRSFTTMAAQTKPRLYHSIAMLLPDGRVLSSGGGRDGPGIDQLNAEIYSPPYLFKGARPVITSAPDVVTFASSFSVQTPDAASISAVHLIRIGAPTHSYDQDQRLIKLNWNAIAGGLNIQAPANANIAPPGFYMLFLVNANGVPSVAKILRLPLASAGARPTAPGNLVAVGGIGTASLSWNASTSTVGVTNYNVHRSTTSGFTPAVANRIAQPVGTSFVDQGLVAGRYYYRVTAQDPAQQLSDPSNEAIADVLGDTIPPQVTMTAPAAATVSGTVIVSANATDNNAVAGVQFLLNGANLGSEVLSPPYSVSWNTLSLPNGSHTLSARARDLSGNTATSAPLVVNVQNAAPSGLVLALAFNEGVGTTTEDRSGFSNSGLLQNTTWTSSGKFGGALSFNGTNSSVVVNDANQLDLTSGMTLMAWVNPSAISSWRTILLKQDTTDLAYALYANTDRNAPGGYLRVGTATYQATGGSTLPLNTWTHVAVTRSGSAITIFVNGNQVGTGTASGNINVTTGPLRIGGNTIWSEWFQGLIDEVRVYNRGLSLAEIQSVMNSPIAP